MIGIIKLGAVVFATFAIGGRIGLGVYRSVSDKPINRPDGMLTDAATGAVWAGRAVTFVGLSYLSSKV